MWVEYRGTNAYNSWKYVRNWACFRIDPKKSVRVQLHRLWAVISAFGIKRSCWKTVLSSDLAKLAGRTTCDAPQQVHISKRHLPQLFEQVESAFLSSSRRPKKALFSGSGTGVECRFRSIIDFLKKVKLSGDVMYKRRRDVQGAAPIAFTTFLMTFFAYIQWSKARRCGPIRERKDLLVLFIVRATESQPCSKRRLCMRLTDGRIRCRF